VAVGGGAGDEDGVGATGAVWGGSPTGDGEGLLPAVLVLEPAATAAARLIRAVDAFGHDALELVRARDVEHRVECAGERSRDPRGPSVVRQDPLE
jgi:hypothetical protein